MVSVASKQWSMHTLEEGIDHVNTEAELELLSEEEQRLQQELQETLTHSTYVGS